MQHDGRNPADQKLLFASSGDGWTRLTLILFFSCAMGLLEAICVIYLRRLILPEGAGNGRPPQALGRHVELIREASTIIMLAATAWLAGANIRSRIAAFFVMFGIWDILYYAGLWGLAGWPKFWLQWDCLFLIPRPWYGPVLAPILISIFFIFSCGIVFLLEEHGNRTRFSILALALLATGLSLWYWSFIKAGIDILAYGYKDASYAWSIFAGGLAFAVAGAVMVVRKTLFCVCSRTEAMK